MHHALAAPEWAPFSLYVIFMVGNCCHSPFNYSLSGGMHSQRRTFRASSTFHRKIIFGERHQLSFVGECMQEHEICFPFLLNFFWTMCHARDSLTDFLRLGRNFPAPKLIIAKWLESHAIYSTLVDIAIEFIALCWLLCFRNIICQTVRFFGGLETVISIITSK